jgi:hypothetical protein
VLSANLVQHLEANLSDVFFYFCSYSDATAGTSGNLFRSLVAQIVQAHGDTAIYVCDNYVNSYRAASRKALSSLLPELLEIIGTTHLVIDGLDEWDLGEQQIVLMIYCLWLYLRVRQKFAKSSSPVETCQIYLG